MKPQLRYSEHVFFIGVDVHVIAGARQSGRLDVRANRGRVVALDIPLVRGAKSFNLRIVAGELAATPAHIYRVSTDEFFLARIFQILPAWHPSDRRIRKIRARKNSSVDTRYMW